MRKLFLYITLPAVSGIYALYMVLSKLLNKPYFKYCDWYDLYWNLQIFIEQWLED